MPKKDRIYHDGVCLSKVAFVAEAAMRITAGELWFNSIDDKDMANKAFNGAEALWDELCSRFPSDEDEVDE